MSRDRQLVIARLLGASAGLVVFVTMALMIADYAEDRRQAPLDQQRVDELGKLVRQDDSQSPVLEAEWDEQTVDSVARAARVRNEAYVVIGAAVLFLIGAKWFNALQGRRAPSAEVIAVHRALCEKSGAKRKRRPEMLPPPQTPDAPSLDLTFVDETIARLGRTGAATIPILQAIQNHYRYLPAEALERVCDLTEITPAQVAGVSSFYTRFRTTPVGRHLVSICHGTACHVAGARAVTDEVRRQLGISPDSDTDPAGNYTIEEVACMGAARWRGGQDRHGDLRTSGAGTR